MKKSILLATAALTAFFAAPAWAADLRAPAPPPPAPVNTWTGCYVGGGGGYGMWNQDNSTFDSATGNPLYAQTTAGGRGWFGTAQVGCDYQLGGDWVVGAFADSDFGNIHGNAPVWEDFYFGNEKESWAWAVGGRLGYVVMPNLLAFVSGGWRQAHFNAFELIDPTVSTGGPTGNHIAAHTYSGWFIGTGYEYGLKWLPGFFWKTEYRIAEFGAANLPVIVDSTGAFFGETVHARKFEQTVRSELVWRFNWAGPVRAAY